jgi:hypothetical protein
MAIETRPHHGSKGARPGRTHVSTRECASGRFNDFSALKAKRTARLSRQRQPRTIILSAAKQKTAQRRSLVFSL